MYHNEGIFIMGFKKVKLDRKGTTFHYAKSMRPKEIYDWFAEKKTLQEFITNMESHCPIFCYSGMSGISIATVIAHVYHKKVNKNFGMIYVRKPREKSHGTMIEYDLSYLLDKTFNVKKSSRLVFVDDLFETGKTRSRTMKYAFNLLKEVSGPFDNKEFTQILYDNHSISIAHVEQLR